MAANETPSLARSTPGLWRIEPLRQIIMPDNRLVELRPLAASHADLIAEFFNALTPRELYYFFPLTNAAAQRLALEAARDPAYRLIALATDDGKPRLLGYMFLDWGWGDGTMPTFGACLRQGAQSGGLGRAMSEHLFSSAAASGVTQARLTVHADNWRALRLYQRAGFRIIGEQILESQGAKQYQMEVDFRAPIVALADDLTIAARGGLGVGIAAARVQDVVERRTGTRPCIADQPFRSTDRVIVVTDLAALAERPFGMPAPPLDAKAQPGWLISLDPRHLLIGGIGPAAVARAANAYVAMLEGLPPSSVPDIPIAALHLEC